MGDRGNPRPADPLHPQRGDRRPGPLRAARPAEGEVQDLGARLRSCGFPKSRWRTRQAAQPHRGTGAERARGGGILSGDLLVLDGEDPGRRSVRRQGRHSGQHQAVRLSQPDQEQWLRRLPSARPGRDPHGAESVRRLQDRRRRLDPPHPVGPGGRTDDQHRGRPARRRALQILWRLDRPRRQGRTAPPQAGAAVGPRAQRRRHHLGLGRREALSPRSQRDG